MPESRGREKEIFIAPPAKSTGRKPSPRWWAPLFVALLLIGMAYLCTFYLSSGNYPIKSIGQWNIAVGISIMMTGFIMTTRWR